MPSELNRRFDVVCMFQVLEHIANPIHFLRRVADFVKKDGFIVLEVPNFNSYMKKHSKEYSDFQYLRLHLSYFTPATLKKTLEMAGFSNVQISGEQLYSIENSIHWARNKEPFKPYFQFDMPKGLEFVNDYYKKHLQDRLESDCLRAIGRMT